MFFGLSSLIKSYSFCLVSSTWTHTTKNDSLGVHGTAPEPANMIHHPTPHLHIHRKEGAGLTPLFGYIWAHFIGWGLEGVLAIYDDIFPSWNEHSPLKNRWLEDHFRGRFVSLMEGSKFDVAMTHFTPWKTSNMEPKNIHPWIRKKHLPVHHFQVPY